MSKKEKRELTLNLASNPMLSGRLLIRCATMCSVYFVRMVITPEVLFTNFISAFAIKLTARC